MEVLFFIIFGGMLVGFAAYGRKVHKEHKKIRKEFEEMKVETPPIQEVDFRSYDFAESPFFDCYKSLN